MVMVLNSAAKAMKPPGPTKSGLQKQVLGLYKRALRAAQKKDREHASQQDTTTAITGAAGGSDGAAAAAPSNTTLMYVRERFRDDATSVRRMDFNVIEHLIRKGERDLKMLERMKAANFTHIPRPKSPSS